jgi:UDPglucose 6-dehydrogenase
LQAELRARGRCDIEVVHLPEFLREGHAWEDFTCADRIVIGGESEEAVTRIQRLFALLGRPLFLVDRRTAELAKYANNAFLATSVSFANEIGDLADTLGANAADVFGILRADRRIGRRAYLTPGLGFGGHCLPKDTAALEYLAQAHGRPLAQLRATLRVNENRPSDAAAWLRGVLCGLGERRICMAGLAFKPGSEDLRESPMLALAKVLCSEGAVLSAWDPNVRQALQGIDLCCWIEDALLNADALVLGQATEPWRELEPLAVKALMRRPIVYDAPGALEASRWTASGFLVNRGSQTRTLRVGG